MTQHPSRGPAAIPDADPATTGSGAGLVVHRSVRSDQLVGGLAELIAQPLPGSDPFAAEVVSVPTPGVERWLAQTLAERWGSGRWGSGPGGQGVCAGVEFPTLARLLDEVERQASGRGADVDPWHPRSLTWTLLSTFVEVRDEAWFAPVAAHLGDDGSASGAGGGASGSDGSEPREGRRWSTARRLSRLFARYAAERPELLERWADGDDVGSDLEPIPADLGWQPRLWRAVAARVGGPTPSRRLETAIEALHDDPTVVALPPRLSVFGPTRIERRQLGLLAALARHREVHLWLAHPSPAAWRRVAAEPRPTGPLRHRRRPLQQSAHHRLVERLGRDQRELQLLLGEIADDSPAGPEPSLPTTLLGRLQAEVVADQRFSEPYRLAPDDRSVQVHSSHGPNRQVEVLRDVLLGLLADDPTLEPRDVVVMCPDVETFAPLVQAVFGGRGSEHPAGHPGQRLRVRLADRSMQQTNPLLELLVELVDLARSRAEATTLIDLAARPSIARRFGFAPDDQGRLAELVRQSGVRWGIDHLHRDQFGMRAFPQNTWAAGLQRMLLGVAMAEDGQSGWGTVLPLDGVDSAEVELVGALAELVSRLRRVVTAFEHPQSLDAWVAAAREALTSLTAVGTDEQWQLTHAFAQLATLGGRAGADEPGPASPEVTGPDDGGEPALLSPADFRALLGDELRARPGRGSFRTGALTVCTLSPMRAVPHRVVCLLGLDDGVFPRPGVLDGDDVLARQPMIGDHDRLSEDRQLLLDAVMAAEERLVVVHAGAHARTGETRPDAVPLRELLDALDETATTGRSRADGRPLPVSEAVRTRHPLQPFAAANFVAPETGAEPLSFDVHALAGARAALGPRERPGGLDVARLPAVPPSELVELDDLLRFLVHPATAFLRARFGLVPDRDTPLPTDEMPVDPDALQRWAVGHRVLQGALAGHGWDALAQAERLRGELAPGPLGELLLEEVREQIDGIITLAGIDPTRLPETVDVRVDLAGQTLTGAVTGVRGDTLTTLSYSKLGPKQQLETWVRLLVLSAAYPGTDWRARSIGRITRWSQPVLLPPIAPDRARDLLTRLLALHREGLRQPLPLPVQTAEAYARGRRSGLGDDETLAQPGLRGTAQREFSRDASWPRLVGATLEDVLAVPATPAEREAFGVAHRFGALALTVWAPLLQHRERR